MTLAEPGSPCSLPRDGGHAVESLALAHCGRPTSFTRCWGGPGTPWPCQARGYGRNIENFGDGQRLPKLPAGVRVTPGAPPSRVVSDHSSELRRSCGGTCLTPMMSWTRVIASSDRRFVLAENPVTHWLSALCRG